MPQGSLFYWAGLLEGRYNQEFLRRLPSRRTNISRFRILAALSQLDKLTVGELARHTSIERTAISRLVDRMESQGLLVRGRKSGDRRAAQISITEKGLADLQELVPIRHDVLRQAMRGIDPAEVERAQDLLRRMLANLGGAGSGGAEA